jgi:hypothetical protein
MRFELISMRGMAIWESWTLAAVSKARMIGDIEVKLVSPPPEHAPVVALFAANVAAVGTPWSISVTVLALACFWIRVSRLADRRQLLLPAVESWESANSAKAREKLASQGSWPG